MPTGLDARQRGISLRDAWWRFAPTHLLVQFEGLQQKSRDSNVGVEISQLETMPASEIKQHLLHSVQEAFAHLSQSGGIHDETKQGLLSRLSRGTLVAYGFPLENDKAAIEPYEVPPLLSSL